MKNNIKIFKPVFDLPLQKYNNNLNLNCKIKAPININFGSSFMQKLFNILVEFLCNLHILLTLLP